MKLSNKQYDTLKWIALVVIPASATLVLTIGKIWGLPYYDNIGATISALGLFIAAIIGTSSDEYKGDGLQTTFNTDSIDEMIDDIIEVKDNETENDTAEE